MPRNTERPPTPEGFWRVDQLATFLGVADETVRVWIRSGNLAAERRRWRGKPYYLIAQQEVDRMLLAGDRPFGDAAGRLVSAGERGSGSAYALGALAIAVAPGLHNREHVLLLAAAAAGFLIFLGVLWILAGRMDRP